MPTCELKMTWDDGMLCRSRVYGMQMHTLWQHHLGSPGRIRRVKPMTCSWHSNRIGLGKLHITISCLKQFSHDLGWQGADLIDRMVDVNGTCHTMSYTFSQQASTSTTMNITASFLCPRCVSEDRLSQLTDHSFSSLSFKLTQMVFNEVQVQAVCN